jgi:hypothetical protein
MVLNVSTGQSEKYYIPLDQRIYVLEDIDAQSDLVMERTAKVKVAPDVPVSIKTNPNKPDTNSNDDSWVQSEKIDLSFLLNLLDGVLEIPGRIVMMTSNFPEKLDHALVRPGRIDVIANFTKCSHETMIEMMEFFYDIVLTDKEKEAILRTKEYVISPAEMSKVMFENFGNHTGAIQKIGEIALPSIQSIKSEELPIEVETTDEAIFQPQMVDETRDKAIYKPFVVDEIEKEKNKLVEASPEMIQMLLDAQTNVKNTNFVTDNYLTDRIDRIDRMNDRKQQLSECNEKAQQKILNADDKLEAWRLDPVDKIETFSDYMYETNQFSTFE